MTTVSFRKFAAGQGWLPRLPHSRKETVLVVSQAVSNNSDQPQKGDTGKRYEPESEVDPALPSWAQALPATAPWGKAVPLPAMHGIVEKSFRPMSLWASA
jgi:hypothetical protein